jgi:hypothetical protein
MNNQQIQICSTDPASRFSGAEYRQTAEAILAVHGRVEIDVSDVLSLSDSFADELFGVLAGERGLCWFLEHVKVSGASEPVLRAIATAVSRRTPAVAV